MRLLHITVHPHMQVCAIRNFGYNHYKILVTPLTVSLFHRNTVNLVVDISSVENTV